MYKNVPKRDKIYILLIYVLILFETIVTILNNSHNNKCKVKNSMVNPRNASLMHEIIIEMNQLMSGVPKSR